MTRITAVTRGQLHVDLVYNDGGYTIAGQHLLHPDDQFLGTDEYEYWLRIPADATARFAAALDTYVEGIPDAWESQVQEIAAHGERRWLEAHGVPFTFHSYS